MVSQDSSLNIAVTGMAARFPGPRSIDIWWDSLLDGAVHSRHYESDELLSAGVSKELAEDPDYIPVRGHLDRWDHFDHEFFHMSPREAELTEPQIRLMLEVAWNALEDAAVVARDPSAVTGVYASMTGSGYLRAMLSGGPLEPGLLDDLIHGTEPDFTASRIAYKLGLTGPALAVQTACSSSLVAVHLAVQALLNGDCDQALVVAAGLAYPQAGYLHLPGGVLSASGVCRPFDKGADGVVAGSGVGCVVLRRMSDVRDDEPEPYGVILGTAVNNDGNAKAGYYAPSSAGQEAVIRAALDAADVGAESIGYLEMHGTGTRIGDPIEWSAAASALRDAGPGRIAVGALKANIGHLDAAAGVAALIRALLVVSKGIIPPVAGFSALNPLLGSTDSALYVPTEPVRWTDGRPRRAGVSAFGIGGTNAHIVLEQAPLRPVAAELAEGPARHRLVLLSAADREALARRAGDLANYLEAPDRDLDQVCATLAAGRTALGERMAVTGRTGAEIACRLRQGSGAKGRRPTTGPAPVVFLMPGQGTQRPGMALPFAAALPGFAEILDSCLDVFDASHATRIRSALFDPGFPADELDRTELAQPAVFSLGYSAATALIRLGVRPSALCGHSLGEIAAACIAGVLSLPDAAAFVTARGRAMQGCAPGAMLAVGCEPERAQGLVAQMGLELDLAAVNSPSSCVLAGSSTAVEEFRRQVGGEFPVHRLRGSRAFHSRLIGPALPQLAEVLAAVELRPPTVAIALNASGEILTSGSPVPQQLFTEQARRPVLFAGALAALAESLPDSVAVEIGPGRPLSPMAEEAGLATLAFDPGGSASEESVVAGLGALWTLGQPIPVDILAGPARRTRLPGYPFAGPRLLAPEAMPPATPMGHEAGPPSGSLNSVGSAAGDVTQRSLDAEATVVRIWIELLGRDDFTEDADFFLVGGDSLKVTRLIRRINSELGIRVPVREVLTSRTLGAHIALVRAHCGD